MPSPHIEASSHHVCSSWAALNKAAVAVAQTSYVQSLSMPDYAGSSSCDAQ